MDLYEKITAELEPLGGELFIDKLLEVRRELLAKKRAAMEKAEAPPPQEERPPAEETARQPERSGQPRKLQDEVQDFMRRGEIEGTDSDEIQEFMRERSGFDPGSLE